MTLGDLLTIFLIVMGICLLVMAILSLAKRKMTEPFCLAWAIVSVLLVICGILIKPSELERYISLRILILVFLITIGAAWTLWFISCLLYTSDAADEEDSVDLGGCRIIKKKEKSGNGGEGRRHTMKYE